MGAYLCNKSLQSCLVFCNPMDCSLPGFSVHGIFQARILEWVAISFSRRSSQPMILQSRILEWVAIPPSRGDLLDPGIEPMSHYVSCIGRWVLYH